MLNSQEVEKIVYRVLYTLYSSSSNGDIFIITVVQYQKQEINIGTLLLMGLQISFSFRHLCVWECI